MVPRPQLTQRCRKEERGTDALTAQLEEKLYSSLEEVPDHIMKTENGPAVTLKPKKHNFLHIQDFLCKGAA